MSGSPASSRSGRGPDCSARRRSGAGRAARRPPDQAARAELRARPEHGAPHRRRGRARPGRRRGRGRPGPRLADPGAAARRAAHVYAVEIDPPLAGALPATVADRAPAVADRLTVLNRDALRIAAADFAGAATDRAGREPAVQRRGPGRAAPARRAAEPAARPGDGAEGGRRPARRRARLQDLRRADREARLVRRGAPGRQGAAERLLAGAQRRLRAGRVHPPASRRRTPTGEPSSR